MRDTKRLAGLAVYADAELDSVAVGPQRDDRSVPASAAAGACLTASDAQEKKVRGLAYLSLWLCVSSLAECYMTQILKPMVSALAVSIARMISIGVRRKSHDTLYYAAISSSLSSVSDRSVRK